VFDDSDLDRTVVGDIVPLEYGKTGAPSSLTPGIRNAAMSPHDWDRKAATTRTIGGSEAAALAAA